MPTTPPNPLNSGEGTSLVRSDIFATQEQNQTGVQVHLHTVAVLIILAALLLVGCTQMQRKTHIAGEGVVLAGTAPTTLLGQKITAQSVHVTDAYAGGKTIYEPGRDYVLDPTLGTIARTPNSRIPDFSTNVLYGKQNFDQGQFPGYGNGKFFAWLSCDCAVAPTLVHPTDQSALLPRTLAMLKAGGPFKIVAFGDSITAGGEASTVDLQFPMRFGAYLRRKHPEANITVENTATGGDNTVMGLERLSDKVLTHKPDLVLVGFGMNDCNLPGVGGVALPDFQNNLVSMVNQIREKTGAEVILFSAFPPNPLWHWSTHHMEQYAAATKAAADQAHCAYADVYSVFEIVLQRKDPSSMLGNNINHPNDFGHWLYLQALESIGL